MKVYIYKYIFTTIKHVHQIYVCCNMRQHIFIFKHVLVKISSAPYRLSVGLDFAHALHQASVGNIRQLVGITSNGCPATICGGVVLYKPRGALQETPHPLVVHCASTS